MEPLVSAGVIEVPMRVDQVRHRLGAQAGQGLAELRTRHAYSADDQHLSLRSRQNGNIAARALEDAYVPSQIVGRHWRRCRTVFDESYEPTRLCKGLARRKPPTSRCKGRTRHAAETKLTA